MQAKQLRMVMCLETAEKFYFTAQTNRQAMECMLYTLNLRDKDSNATIGAVGRCYSMVHGGKTYTCLSDEYYGGKI